MPNFDVIIVGAGSVGVPTAMALGAAGVKTLVMDAKPSPGQGDNKRAIGGIRATHSDPGKILVGLRSLEIFSTWKERYGEDIEWLKGGYLFPVYREQEERSLKRLLPLQRQFGLNINFIDPDTLQAIVPGIDPKGLRGGTFSLRTVRHHHFWPSMPSHEKLLKTGSDSNLMNGSTPCWWTGGGSWVSKQTRADTGRRSWSMRPAPIRGRFA
jgi:glycine/D-amino acid oxidase-like deaminating enzyme